ncbi:unnamed protein product [Cuscuta campestris]|uniref:Uncharacterized protein n=1 Tax=Cuscuta campestris TaxID=132261 RepID=A0A484MYF5_9ASTE|nr:unnamed protein product [Cuscuta campestris]
MLLAGPDQHWRINHVGWFRALSKAQNAPFFQGPLFRVIKIFYWPFDIYYPGKALAHPPFKSSLRRGK